MSRLAMAVAVALHLSAGTAAGFVPEPDGYRGPPYRAPVPTTLAGAQLVDDAGAHELWRGARAAFVDVLPRSPKPEGLPAGTVWHEAARQSIPGALWLPNTGYEALTADEAALLAAGLVHATGGDPAAPIVIFCLADCWMSWNVARRAVEAGYSAVFWYPGGTDGWVEQGWPLEPVAPFQP